MKFPIDKSGYLLKIIMNFYVCSIDEVASCLLHNANILLLRDLLSKFKSFSSISCLWCPALPSQEIFQVGPEDWPLSLERSSSATTDRPRGLVKPASGIKLHLHKIILLKSNKKLKMRSSTSLRSFFLLTTLLHGNDFFFLIIHRPLHQIYLS